MAPTPAQTWRRRIAIGTSASVLLGATLGGIEVGLALRSSVQSLLLPVDRLVLWATNVGVCAGLAAVFGGVLSSWLGAFAGQSTDVKALAYDTGRDPFFPWLPGVLAPVLGVVLLGQFLPTGLAVLAQGARFEGVLLCGLALPLAGMAFVGLRFFLWRMDTTGRGAAFAYLGLPTLLILSLSFAVAAPLSGGKGARARAQEGLPNVILVTVDGLRTDHVGPRARVRTPTLSWLARKGVYFRQLSTPSTAEAPPLAALMTGRHPLSLGFASDGAQLPPRSAGNAGPTLAEVYRGEGFRTAAFLSSRALDGPSTGLDRGFEVYDDGSLSRPRGWHRLGVCRLLEGLWRVAGHPAPPEEVWRPSHYTLSRLTQWLAYHYRESFFVWVHLSDPRMVHYTPPGVDIERLVDPIPGPEGRAYGVRVSHLDSMLGELFESLEDDGLLGRTLVAVVGTRGAVPGSKGPGVSEPWSQVPAILYGPTLSGARDVDRQARLMDLAPTLMSVGGLMRHRFGDGHSFVPHLRGKPMETLQALIVGPPRGAAGRSPIALRTPEWKYVREPRGGAALYLLPDDPRELYDKSDERADLVQGTAAQLTRIFGSFVPRTQAAPPDLVRAPALRAVESHW